MKFTTSQSDLNTHLSLISRAVSARPTHPVLGNVLVVADAKKREVRLTGFDLSLGIRSGFPAEISESGEITLPAKLLGDIVAKIGTKDITVSVSNSEESEGHVLAFLKTASGQFQIRGMKADEFPELPVAEKGEIFSLPIESLTEGLKGSLFATSNDPTKQVLTGVRVTKTIDTLEFASTDGHRLAMVQTSLESDESDTTKEFAVTIPATALRELDRILSSKSTGDRVSLYIDETQAIFETENQRLTSRCLDGAYPNYRQLIPTSFDRSIVLDRKHLIRCLEIISVLTDGKNNLVKFTIDGENDRLHFSVESPDLGSAKESMSAEITGESGAIAFNIKYLMDGLKALPGNDIRMDFNDPDRPVVFTPLCGLKMTYLVMPVQIRS